MRKKLFLIIFSLTLICSLAFVNNAFFADNIVFASAAEATQPTDNTIYPKEIMGTSLNPNISIFSYGLNDEISLEFEIVSNIMVTVSSVSFENDGFSVRQSPFISNNIIKAHITYNGFSENPTFTVYTNLTNGTQLKAIIYGVVEGGTLYISGNSIDAARDIYFSAMLESGTMTRNEYELLSNAQRGGFTEIYSTTPEFVPLSTTGGWVTGTLQWQDDKNDLHPLQFVKVTIFDAGPSAEQNLGTVYTNANGVYNFSFSSNRTGGRDIFIRVWPQGENIEVRTGTNGEHVWRSATTFSIATGSTTTINRTFNMRNTGTTVGGVGGDGDLGRAFQVSQAVIFADRYVTTMRGGAISKVTVQYPGTGGTRYSSSASTMYICDSTGDPDYADWDVIMHEFGHHAQYKLSIINSPGGSHSSTENLADRLGKSSDIRLAYSESWPTIFGELAQQYFKSSLTNIAGVADGGYTDSSVVTPYPTTANFYYNSITYRNGEAVERSIMGVLWDTYDSGTKTAGYSKLNKGHSGFWSVTVTGNPKIFSDFAARFHAVYTSTTERDNFGKILQYYRMAPENINHTGTSLTAATAPSFTWTANGTSNTLQNNKFDLVFYNSSRTQISRFDNITTTLSGTTRTSRQLTTNEWNTILNASGSTFFVAVVGYQTDSPATGGYTTSFYEFTKPTTFTTTTNSTGLTITGATGNVPANLEFPARINGTLVTQIGNGSSTVSGLAGVTNITFESGSGVTTIAASAFSGCTQLSQITIPASVTTIGDSAFANCTNLGSGGYVMYLPASVTNIGNYVFANCEGLSNINIPNSVTSIGDYAFYDCTSLESITLPSNLLIINEGVFMGCSSLEDIYFPDTELVIQQLAFANCTSLKNVILPKSTMVIEKGTFYGCNNLESITLPFVGNAASFDIINPVESSYYSYFGYIFKYIENADDLDDPYGMVDNSYIPSSLKSVTIDSHASNVVIEISAFANSEYIEHVVLTESVVSIENYAFSGCSGLESINIPGTVTNIGNAVFKGCESLEEITLPDELISLSDRVFSECKALTTVNLPTNLTNIGAAAFYDCISLTSIDLPDTLTVIKNSAFENCESLSEIILPDTLTSIGVAAFYRCVSLISVIIPDSITTISMGLFDSCSNLESITLPADLVEIGELAFANCSSLISIIISGSVTNIGPNAFLNCSSLVIYCAIDTEGSGWSDNWNYSNCPVYWDYYNMGGIVLFSGSTTSTTIYFADGITVSYMIGDRILIEAECFDSEYEVEVTYINYNVYQGQIVCIWIVEYVYGDGVTVGTYYARLSIELNFYADRVEIIASTIYEGIVEEGGLPDWASSYIPTIFKITLIQEVV